MQRTKATLDTKLLLCIEKGWDSGVTAPCPVTSPTVIELMSSSWPPQATPPGTFITRKPVRITATVSWATYQSLIEESTMEGRSLSNLTSYVLESHVKSGER